MALQSPKKEIVLGGQVLLVAFIIVSLVLVIIYAREGEDGPLHSAQGVVSGLSAPFKLAGSAVGSAGEGIGDTVTNATASDDSLTGLRRQNEELRSIVSQLEEYRLESERLRSLLDLRDMYGMQSVTARTMGTVGNAWNQVITIDKGTNDGIKTGLSVMGGYGLVGQVIAVTPTTADVRLITDQQSGVSAMVQSSRDEGIVRGSLEGLLYLESLPSESKVEVGDVVVTSGLGGSHSRGLIIGTVSSVNQKQGDAMPTIVIAPNGKTGPLEEVLIVLEVNSETALSASTRLATTE